MDSERVVRAFRLRRTRSASAEQARVEPANRQRDPDSQRDREGHLAQALEGGPPAEGHEWGRRVELLEFLLPVRELADVLVSASQQREDRKADEEDEVRDEDAGHQQVDQAEQPDAH